MTDGGRSTERKQFSRHTSTSQQQHVSSAESGEVRCLVMSNADTWGKTTEVFRANQSCNPLDPRGKAAKVWLTEGNLAKNCGSRNEEDEPQLGRHPMAGQ